MPDPRKRYIDLYLQKNGIDDDDMLANWIMIGEDTIVYENHLNYTSWNRQFGELIEAKASFIDNDCPITITYSGVESAPLRRSLEQEQYQEQKLLFQVTPIPATDALYVKFYDEDRYFIHILDMSGQIVYQQKIYGNEAKIDVSNINSGVYTLIVSKGLSEEYQKIIIQK